MMKVALMKNFPPRAKPVRRVVRSVITKTKIHLKVFTAGGKNATGRKKILKNIAILEEENWKVRQ